MNSLKYLYTSGLNSHYHKEESIETEKFEAVKLHFNDIYSEISEKSRYFQGNLVNS